MQNVVRGVGFGGLASLILACAMAAPAAAVEVPQVHPPLPNVHIAPPKIAPPKITAPKSHVHAPTQPTPKGNALHPPKGLQQNNISNAPTGGGNTTGGGVKVLQGTPTSPSGGTTTGGEAIGVNKQIDQPSLQGGGNATGDGVKVLQGTPASPQTNPSGTTTGGGENASPTRLQGVQPIDNSNTNPSGGTTKGGGVEVLQTPASPQTNPGGGTTTGGGVKVETGEVNQPAPPSGGTTAGGAPIIDLKPILKALQQATPPGGGTAKGVSLNLETLRDLLQQCKAGQASPAGGCTVNETPLDPAQIESAITLMEQNNDAFNSVIEQAIKSAGPSKSMKLYYDRANTGVSTTGANLCAIWSECESHTTCIYNIGSGAEYCTTTTTCQDYNHCLF